MLNDDGSARTQKVVQNGVISSVPVTMNVPSYQLITPGGDTQVVGNFEYRIPIVGPVTLALFTDAGVNKILRPNQLTMEPEPRGRPEQRVPAGRFRRQGADRARAPKKCAFRPAWSCR